MILIVYNLPYLFMDEDKERVYKFWVDGFLKYGFLNPQAGLITIWNCFTAKSHLKNLI